MYVSNERVWKSAQAVARYQQQLHQGLTPAEEHCISKTAANGTTLDIGVGTGRTTAVIGRKFKTYIGIDYSSEMINEAQRNFPDMDLRVMDARNLQFPRNSFDTILFPFNGIDCVDYDGRRRIISEVHPDLFVPKFFFQKILQKSFQKPLTPPLVSFIFSAVVGP